VAVAEHAGPNYERVIDPPRGIEFNLRELIAERELLWFLTLRNLQVRYKQSLAGPGWAVFQPLLGTVVFALVFGHYAGLPTDGIPYAVFYLTGFLIWTYVANTLALAADSVTDNAPMVSKVYFPRIFLPVAAALAGLVDLAIGLVMGMIVFLAYGTDLGLRTFLAFGPILIAALASCGAGLILGGLNARYRDVRLLVPFLVQIGLFTSPVAFSSSILPDNLQTLYGLNPIAGAIEGFRWCITGEGAATVPMVAVSAAVSVITFVAGAALFQRMDTSLADVV
jgi:lipopolysaccharide transport system permease protein